MLSTPAPGPTYVSTGMSAGAGGVPDPDVTSTLLVPVNRGCVPASAMIETLSVSGDESKATWISRSMPDESGGRATVVSASVSVAGRTTMMRTWSIAKPKLAKAASEGRMGAKTTCPCPAPVPRGPSASRQVATDSASARAASARRPAAGQTRRGDT